MGIHSRTLTPILSGKCEKKDESNMSGGTSCLSVTVSVLGVIFCACSVTGIAMSLFLVFGDPLPTSFTQDTYSPYWEDIGPAMVVSVVSLLVNVLLIGGARQLSKDFLLVWIIWKCVAIVLVWLWYGYNVLKDYGYIDWTAYGMKGCLFCSYERYEPEIRNYVVSGCVIFTIVILFAIFPVEILRSRLKKRHRELTEPLGLYNSQHNLSPYQQQQNYEMYQREQNEMLRRQVLQQYQQYPPPNPQSHPALSQEYHQQLHPSHHHHQGQGQPWQYYPANSVQYR